ncbi:hypothetical protein G7046_g5430 [Stylonectria norvegica]|nr:hypothetical protein G7046_g5430 [Stylonectria norvegica]
MNFFNKQVGDLKATLESHVNSATAAFSGNEPEKHSHSHLGGDCDHLHDDQSENRFHSFAPESSGNVKWYVDGCSYFWAVSEALEQAKESIFILDWWLSPELYLRRPPSKNERYRLDNMLKAAAERGVKVHIIVYREVEAALTLDSAHTRTALEKLHPNIGVFRHPDHTPTGYDFTAEIGKSFNNLTTFDIFKASGDAVKAIYGTAGDVVLFWAHHEKLLVIDRKIGFMGGLDMCFGRWDTSSHPIADAHPGDLDAIIFPGQDYNNARVSDFADVSKVVDRTKSSRMGWSDVALSMNGPIIDDLVDHFVDRWNFIFNEKYAKKNPGKYQALIGDRPATPDPNSSPTKEDYLGGLTEHFSRGFNTLMHGHGSKSYGHGRHREDIPRIQLTRRHVNPLINCCEWSAGHKTEHSIANAYLHAISTAEHFVYIENQFFITATDDKQRPVQNKIGAAIVERIVRAFQAGETFKIWVVMPAVPAFAGDLQANDAIGTRAIMEFQYSSISRGGHSILEKLREAGIPDPSKYIGFFNLRNFDRINTSKTMAAAEAKSGVRYEDARKEHDEYVGGGGYPVNPEQHGSIDQYEKYQREAQNVGNNTLDTISSCYMDGSGSVVDLPWEGEPEDEINAFVTEELYIHSKLLIADDRLVICGSANLNDRSQLGSHDSEIAVIIEDPTPVESRMNGQPYTASRFAASLRRYIFRKHLGLIPDQRWDRPDQNWQPVDRSPNAYDWGSAADGLVRDPLHANFQNLWNGTARSNTEVFSRAFHPVPNDHVRTWAAYKEFYSSHFTVPGKKQTDEEKRGKVEYGHIIREEFPGGVQEVKEWLARIRGTLVEMPLGFLADVDDIAKEDMTFNSLTAELYT